MHHGGTQVFRSFISGINRLLFREHRSTLQTGADYRAYKEVFMDGLNRWQDRSEILVGIWLCIAPWVLSFSEPASWCAMVVGASVILLSVEDLFLPSQIEEWGNIILGLGLMISPWAWGYADHILATWNALACGFLISGVAVWALERMLAFVRNEKIGEMQLTDTKQVTASMTQG
jgi:hypothetical protein